MATNGLSNLWGILDSKPQYTNSSMADYFTNSDGTVDMNKFSLVAQHDPDLAIEAGNQGLTFNENGVGTYGNNTSSDGLFGTDFTLDNGLDLLGGGLSILGYLDNSKLRDKQMQNYDTQIATNNYALATNRQHKDWMNSQFNAGTFK